MDWLRHDLRLALRSLRNRPGFSALAIDNATEEIWTLAVSGDYFSIVAAMPRAGRLLGRGDGERDDLPRTTAGFVGACGAVAVVLSAIGLFGVTYFAVGQRRREFGVRLAIGAHGREVQRQVVFEALTLAAPGIALGVLIAAVAGFFLRSFFVGLDAASIIPFAGAAAGQTFVMVLASWSPAIRASRSNPADLLRAE
jgi:ABC-type antimicrobial peptide transport system permease subunit